MSKRPVWYINFPTYKYVENVKALAKQRGLQIVDARYQGDNSQCDDAPELTLKSAPASVEVVEPADVVDGDVTDDATPLDISGNDETTDDDDRSNHDKLFDYFVEHDLTAKPGVAVMETELGIDTNGAEIQAAWDAFKAEAE